MSWGKHVGGRIGKSVWHNPEMRCRAVTGEVSDPTLPRKTSSELTRVPVPQTDAGGQVENTKAIEITLVKELGKLPP